jgi:hypothetical protein
MRADSVPREPCVDDHVIVDDYDHDADHVAVADHDHVNVNVLRAGGHLKTGPMSAR